jgi:hypothetical protein
MPAVTIQQTELAGDWIIMVPGSDEPYSAHNDADGWVDAFLSMVDRLSDSKKTSTEDKMFKIGEFERVNSSMFPKVRDASDGLYEILTSGIGKAKQDLNMRLRGDAPK